MLAQSECGENDFPGLLNFKDTAVYIDIVCKNMNECLGRNLIYLISYFVLDWQAKNKNDRVESDMTYASLNSTFTHKDLCKLLLSKGTWTCNIYYVYYVCLSALSETGGEKMKRFFFFLNVRCHVIGNIGKQE